MSDTHTNLQRFVDRLNLRSALTDEDQQAILSLPSTIMHVRRKRDFVEVDERPCYSFFVVSGMVGRFGETQRGVRQITAFHIAGDMVDLHSAVRPVAMGGLEALSDTTLLRVPHAALRALAARYPAVSEAFWRDCVLDAAILMQWIVNIGRRDARSRLAHIFCEMAVRFGDEGAPLCHFPFPLTQDQIGEAVSLTAVHVSRSLKELQDLVRIRGGCAHISNWAELAKVGDFDAAYLAADIEPEQHKRLLVAA